MFYGTFKTVKILKRCRNSRRLLWHFWQKRGCFSQAGKSLTSSYACTGFQGFLSFSDNRGHVWISWFSCPGAGPSGWDPARGLIYTPGSNIYLYSPCRKWLKMGQNSPNWWHVWAQKIQVCAVSYSAHSNARIEELTQTQYHYYTV